MRFDNSIRVKKGYMLVYTLVLFTICIITILICVDFAISENKNLFFTKKYMLNNDEKYKYKEILFTDLNEYLHDNVAGLSKSSIKAFMLTKASLFVINYESSCLKYDSSKDCFVLIYTFSSNKLKEDFYNYDFVNGSVSYSFSSTTFVEGRL